MITINVTMFISFLMVFALIYLSIGLWAARSVKTATNYFLANRNLSLMQLTFALIASQLGSGMILGTAFRAYHIGIWGLLYTIGMSLGFIILGCGLASRMRNLNVTTTAEIFETHYQSTTLKKIASLLSVVSLWGILVAQIVASKTLLTGLNIIDPYTFICCWLLVICYTMLGGLHSIIMVDIAQVSCIIMIFAVALWYTIPQVALTQNFYSMQLQYFKNDATFACLAPALFIPTLFALIEQDLAQKFFAAKNQITATLSSLSAGFFLIVFSSIPLLFGILAKTTPEIAAFTGNPLIASLAHYCPQPIFLLAICAIIAAITSTANSLMCAISSNIVQDFQRTTTLLNIKIISAAIGCSALIASFFIQGDIIAILEESYRISVVCLCVPTLYAYFNKPSQAKPAWAACVFGFVGYVIMHIFPSTPLVNDLVALTLSFLGFFIAQQIHSSKK